MIKLNPLVRGLIGSLSLLPLSHAAELSNQLSNHYVTVHGQAIHYAQIGESGTPVVLLTGYATTSNFWNRDFVSCLASNHQVYLFDYAGINVAESAPKQISLQSMAANTNALVTQLKLNDVTLVGWSMGGGVALEASFESPNLYQHLYLLAPIVPLAKGSLSLSHPSAPKFNSESDVLNYVFGNNLYNYTPDQLPKWQSEFIGESQVSQLFPHEAIIQAQGPAISLWIASPAARNNFQHSQVPATFILPGHDLMLNQSIAQTAISNYPNSTIVIVPKSGHALAWQQPDEMCHIIDASE